MIGAFLGALAGCVVGIPIALWICQHIMVGEVVGADLDPAAAPELDEAPLPPDAREVKSWQS